MVEANKITIGNIETAMVTWLSIKNDKRSEDQARYKQEADELAELGEPLKVCPPLPVARYIEGYGGQLDSEEAMSMVLSMAPAIWVTYDGETTVLKGQSLIRQISMVVMVLTTSYNTGEIRLGSHQTPGLYQLIEAVMEDLANQSCGLDITPLQLNSVTPLWRGGSEGGGFSLATLRFTTEIYTTAEHQPDVICEEPQLVVNWKLTGISDFVTIEKPWADNKSSQ
jgi:phage gp37-like protein